MSSEIEEETAEEIYTRLKFYCDFHGLDMLTSQSSKCIYDLSVLMSEIKSNK